ncbi:MAG: hypothetical protein ABR592_01420 [Nitriliruptorales bacterium]
MDALLLIVVLVLVLMAIVIWRRRQKAPGRGPRPAASSVSPRAAAALPGPQAAITLDIVAVDPEHPAVQRLVRDAASRVLRTSPGVVVVTVEDRAGTRLGTIERNPGPSELTPLAQEVPKAGGRSRPSSWSGPEQTRTSRADEQKTAPHRSLAERFELPDVVRTRLRRPNDAVDIVRAILEAAELPAEVHDNLVLSGADAVIVVSETHGTASEAFSDAFLRFQKSGASQGVVITLGTFGIREMQRRQALAPSLRYAGMSAIQRMADAVALSGNPLRFATDPAFLA